VIDVDPGILLDRLDGAGHAERGAVAVEVPDRERLVDLELVRRGHLPVAHLAGRDVHPGVARDRHDLAHFRSAGTWTIIVVSDWSVTSPVPKPPPCPLRVSEPRTRMFSACGCVSTG